METVGGYDVLLWCGSEKNKKLLGDKCKEINFTIMRLLKEVQGVEDVIGVAEGGHIPEIVCEDIEATDWNIMRHFIKGPMTIDRAIEELQRRAIREVMGEDFDVDAVFEDKMK